MLLTKSVCLCSFLVFHGGSGSTKEEIQTAVDHGVVKMNVDTGQFRVVPLGLTRALN